MDIVEQTLNEQHDIYAEAREEYRKLIQQQRDEIERLRDALWEIWYLNASDKDNSIAMATIAYDALKGEE